ncbi:uncharacterized protein MONBRDRAFT_37365 [Monosiga brevicollis MX1]|uniref:GPS domain-containing protein n=1 Tax=Monosiga brevicollis TaxID=81824 RepID=A9V191_MONBE|nr:uncharacterized protein MONBRDRAFT_37365 [Monosiga brevicollis MX1]EDQ88767.1 predicted protein [Monosiga brevicollis MX1]|eukprot:XP_001746380.1 hypothetical protein [Monosiga brevicollis MX1]
MGLQPRLPGRLAALALLLGLLLAVARAADFPTNCTNVPRRPEPLSTFSHHTIDRPLTSRLEPPAPTGIFSGDTALLPSTNAQLPDAGWEQARDTCEGLGAILATLDDAADLELVSNLLAPLGLTSTNLWLARTAMLAALVCWVTFFSRPPAAPRSPFSVVHQVCPSTRDPTLLFPNPDQSSRQAAPSTSLGLITINALHGFWHRLLAANLIRDILASLTCDEGCPDDADCILGTCVCRAPFFESDGQGGCRARCGSNDLLSLLLQVPCGNHRVGNQSLSCAGTDLVRDTAACLLEPVERILDLALEVIPLNDWLEAAEALAFPLLETLTESELNALAQIWDLPIVSAVGLDDAAVAVLRVTANLLNQTMLAASESVFQPFLLPLDLPLKSLIYIIEHTLNSLSKLLLGEYLWIEYGNGYILTQFAQTSMWNTSTSWQVLYPELDGVVRADVVLPFEAFQLAHQAYLLTLPNGTEAPAAGEGTDEGDGHGEAAATWIPTATIIYFEDARMFPLLPTLANFSMSNHSITTNSTTGTNNTINGTSPTANATSEPAVDYSALELVRSPILSITLMDLPADSDLSASPVKMHFTGFNSSDFFPICAWWDAGRWNTSGCTTIVLSDHDIDCVCTHLTSFAVLTGAPTTGASRGGGRGGSTEDKMAEEIGASGGADSTTALSAAEARAMGVLSLVLVSLSMLGAIAALAVIVFGWHAARPYHHNLVLLSLVLLGVYVLFFVVALAAPSDDTNCTAVAWLLHFAVVLLMFASTCQAYQFRQDFVVVFANTQRTAIMRRFGLALALALVVCGLSAAVAPRDYGSDQACFLSPGGLAIWFLWGPCALALLINIVIFLAVLQSIARESRDVSRSKAIWVAMGAFPIALSLGWLLAVWLILYPSLTAEVAFIVVNCPQGLLLFFVFVFRDDRLWKQARHQLVRWWTDSEHSSSLPYTEKPPSSTGSTRVSRASTPTLHTDEQGPLSRRSSVSSSGSRFVLTRPHFKKGPMMSMISEARLYELDDSDEEHQEVRVCQAYDV